MKHITRDEFLASFAPLIGYYNRAEILDNNLGLRAWYRQCMLVCKTTDDLERFFEYIISHCAELPAPAMIVKSYKKEEESNG